MLDYSEYSIKPGTPNFEQAGLPETTFRAGLVPPSITTLDVRISLSMHAKTLDRELHLKWG